MNQTVSVDGLAEAIKQDLRTYTADITAGIKKAVDITEKECRENLKADSPDGVTHKYKKGWRVTVTVNNALTKRVVIHNKEYGLVHLLENGHAIVRTGGRTRAFPHVKKNEEIAIAKFQERVREVIENGR